jgi:hypothetical protein
MYVRLSVRGEELYLVRSNICIADLPSATEALKLVTHTLKHQLTRLPCANGAANFWVAVPKVSIQSLCPFLDSFAGLQDFPKTAGQDIQHRQSLLPSVLVRFHDSKHNLDAASVLFFRPSFAAHTRNTFEPERQLQKAHLLQLSPFELIFRDHIRHLALCVVDVIYGDAEGVNDLTVWQG